MTAQVKCQQCGSPMRKTKKVNRSCMLQLFGVALFLLGVALLFLFPIGTVIGIFVMLGAARMGYSKSKVWKCANCGYFFERA
jgi:predicted nucleic acid-binding Zn ribbon protein